MKLRYKALLSALGLPVLASPAFAMSSCSQTWGYLNPISFGSLETDNVNNPYYNFRDFDGTDADGIPLIRYLQSNYIVDQSKSSIYAFSSPASKWYDKSDKEDEKILPQDQWQYLADGWKTSASQDFESTVTISTKKDDKTVKTNYANNMNMTLANNINFTGSIALTLSNYLSSALQYQAAQIGNDEDLKISWGTDTGIEGLERPYYEFDFASSNMHATGKSKAFMRVNNVNFNYSTFPIPTYEIDEEDDDILDRRLDISAETKKLLLGDYSWTTNHPKIYDTIAAGNVPGYFTLFKGLQGTLIPYKDKDGKEAFYDGKYNYFEFKNVPILIDLKDISYRWINPTKHDSFVPSDYFVTGDGEKSAKAVVTEIIGDAWKNMKDFTGEDDCTPHYETYKYTLQGSKKVTALSTTERDERIPFDSLENDGGNKFIALVTYGVNEYDSSNIIEHYKEDPNLGSDPTKWPEELRPETLTKKNICSISGVTTIFPAYFLALYDDLFKKANEDAVSATPGYILDEKKVNKHLKDLLGIIQRTSSEGIKAPHDLKEDSKNLLQFLTYMFGSSTSVIDFDKILKANQFAE